MHIDVSNLSIYSGRIAEAKNSLQTVIGSSMPNAHAIPADMNSKTIAKYDFTSMTPQQMQSTMNGLIRSGRMSLADSTALSGMIPTPLSKVNYDGNYPDSYYQPHNFIANLQQNLKEANDEKTIASVKATLAVVQHLQGSLASIDTKV